MRRPIDERAQAATEPVDGLLGPRAHFEGANIEATGFTRRAPCRERSERRNVIDAELEAAPTERGDDGRKHVTDLQAGEPIFPQVDGDPLVRKIDDGKERQSR